MLRLICLNQNTYTGLNILREVFVYGLIRSESVMKLLLKYHRVFLMDVMWLFWRPYRYLKEWEAFCLHQVDVIKKPHRLAGLQLTCHAISAFLP